MSALPGHFLCVACFLSFRRFVGGEQALVRIRPIATTLTCVECLGSACAVRFMARVLFSSAWFADTETKAEQALRQAPPHRTANRLRAFVGISSISSRASAAAPAGPPAAGQSHSSIVFISSIPMLQCFARDATTTTTIACQKTNRNKPTKRARTRLDSKKQNARPKR